ncbi:DUF1294 domain-containing protein [Zoogloea sp.]|uniref:DUF1294 domain-containing protein n=1 Tax=Zoogloea sp. TaxID=49181 RepID=UPI0035B13B50
MRHQGKLTKWDDSRGFGFITPNDGSERVFVHIKSVRRGQPRLTETQLLTYERTIDERGRAQAIDVGIAGAPQAPAPRPSQTRTWPLILAAAFFLGLAWTCFSGKAPSRLLLLYGVASLLAFLAYWWDKSAALHGHWRTQEKTLHLYALLGGWPGAIAAQHLLHHKTQKASFRSVFWITVIANCAALGWLHTTQAAAPIRTFLGYV